MLFAKQSFLRMVFLSSMVLVVQYALVQSWKRQWRVPNLGDTSLRVQYIPGSNPLLLIELLIPLFLVQHRTADASRVNPYNPHRVGPCSFRNMYVFDGDLFRCHVGQFRHV
jgi:hypothetical protein